MHRVIMPQAGQTMETGTIVRWLKAEGEVVTRGEVLFEVETDKATLEIEATDSGTLLKILADVGATLPVNTTVALIGSPDEAIEPYLADYKESQRSPSAGAGGTTSSSAATADAPSAIMPRIPGELDSTRPRVSWAARRAARERGIDLSRIPTGSGPDGRIVLADLSEAMGSDASPIRHTMSGMRRAIARNLSLSKQTIPHFYVRLTIDAAPLLALCSREKAKYGCSLNDPIVLACARVVQELSAFRSSIQGDGIVERPTANIGVAVGMEHGLVVPVVIGANRMTLEQLSGETRRIVAAAREGKITGLNEGCFTVTNLGMFGVEEFSAIINPPESAILAVGAVRETVIVEDGAMRPGQVMTVTLSADHRLIDGLVAAQFLTRLKEILENPQQLVCQS